MARQARAELTRDAVLNGAAEVFLRLGYANASLIDIMTQANVTKGALYFHFGSKEELARAVVDLGNERLRAACAGLLEPTVPALEAAIGISYLVADLATRDPMVAAMFNLSRQIGNFQGTNEENIVVRWLDGHAALAKRAIDEGDLLPDLDAASVSRIWIEMTSGVRA
ncbi:MAG: TetR/AcrR family transcriptional regulator, partial [Aldersonia sp.]|nr:TetR/AcrR family transcriptional regulator [Aldersonia sp.]